MPTPNIKPNKFWQVGFSTLEILLAMAILIITLCGAVLTLSNSGGGVTSAMSGSRSLGTDSRANSEALRFAQASLEKAQAEASDDFFNIGTGTANEDIYQRIEASDWSATQDYTKWIKSTVTWNMGTRPQQVEMETLVTSPANAIRGDTCNPNLTGDWTEPKLLGSFDFTSNSAATDIDVRAHKIYLTTDPASFAKHDFYVIDVSGPLVLVKLASIQTGDGLENVVVAGKYAYVANRSINGQLQIIDISNPAAPFIKKTYKVPGVTGTGIYGKSIFYKDGIVYIGLYKADAGPEFNMIDVSDPVNPVYLGGWRAAAQVTDIKVVGDTAYLATAYSSDPLQTVKGQLIVLDVSDPLAITAIDTFDTAKTNQAGESIFIDGDTVYFGRSNGGSGSFEELYTLDASNLNIKSSAVIGDSVNAVIPRGNLLFTMTYDPNLGFQIFDTNTGSTMTTYGSLNIQQASTGGMDCEENLLYIAQRSNGALQIIGPKEGASTE